MTFLRDYFRVLIPLCIAFAIYHATVVPLLEPGLYQQGKVWDASLTAMRDNWWEEFFAENEWQRDKQNPPRVLKTESSTLLFQSREQKSETRWLVKPLTILIRQRDSGNNKRAVLIRNNEGAEIQFKTAVDWTQELPPIVSGQLLGEISIYSPPDDADKNNGMLINARDLRINKRQIWTNQRIRLQLGNSLVEGSFLQIFLDKDLLASEQPSAHKKSPFNGLDRLELTYVERVHVGLEPGGLWPRKDIPDVASRPAHATLTCGGSFEFQFHHSLATLKKGVHMEHLVQGLPVDMFDCAELQMTVASQSKSVPPTPGPEAEKTGSNWKVERVEAFGAVGKNNSDHSGWLRLNAPGMQAEALGQHLDMDVVNGIVTLSNRLPGSTTREMMPVYLKKDEVQVWSPEVQYQSAAAIASASNDPAKLNPSRRINRLGAMLAQGAGRAQMESNGDTWKLSWGERLLVRPDPNETQKDLVDIKGSANISSATHGRFQAEQLYLWLIPTTPEQASELAAQSPQAKAPQWLPDRIEADGKVDVRSPSLRATVEKMQAWFTYPIAFADAAPSASQLPQASPAMAKSDPNELPMRTLLNLTPSTGTNADPLKQPNARKNSQFSKGLLTANPVSPLVVTARTMRANILRKADESRVEDLVLEGNLTLTKNQLSEDSPWPFIVTGDVLQLGQTENGLSDITIVGQPAKVAVGSGWVEAPEMKLKQSDNQFWIDQPGKLLLPVEILQRHTTQQNNSSLVSAPNPFIGTRQNIGFVPAYSPPKGNDNTIRWHEAPKLQWGGRMTFDGRTARFGGGVTIDCKMETDPKTLWHMAARSNQMSVEMEKPVSMQSHQDGSSMPNAQLSVIRLEDSVDLQAVQTDLQGRRRSIEHMKVPQVDIFIPKQLWLAHGPGELWSRRLGNDLSIGNVLPTSGLSKGEATDRSEDGTKYCIHLSFDGRMEGDMVQRKAMFYDRIIAMLGPIASWDNALNVHAVDRPGRNQSILNSDRLEIFDASGLSWNQSPNRAPLSSTRSAWEIAAQSGVKMQSNTDTGDVFIVGESMKYSAINDTVRIEGSPQQPAHISKAGFNGYIRSAAYRLKTGEFEGQITRIEGDVPSNLQQAFSANGTPNVQPSGLPRSNGNLQSPRDIPLRATSR